MVILLVVLGLIVLGLIARLLSLRGLGMVFRDSRGMSRDEMRERLRSTTQERRVDWSLAAVAAAAVVVRLTVDNDVVNAIGSLVIGLIVLVYVRRMGQRLSG